MTIQNPQRYKRVGPAVAALSLLLPMAVPGYGYSQQTDQDNQPGEMTAEPPADSSPKPSARPSTDDDPRRRDSEETSMWIRVQADYDNDGKIDSSGRIHIADFRAALRRSRERVKSRAEGQEGKQSRNDRKAARLRGRISDLKTIELVGRHEPHVMVRLHTDDRRTAKVHLGPWSSLEELSLVEGDVIQVRGRRGQINDLPVLTAERVEKNGRAVDIRYGELTKWKRVRGKLQNVRATEFPGVSSAHLVATIHLKSGRTAHIDLGQAELVDDLQLDDGATIAALVRPDTVRGQQVLVADEIVAGDQHITTTRR